MKAVISRVDFSAALGRVIPAAAKTDTPITTGVLIRGENAHLELRATNFSLEISENIRANIETEGAVVVNAAHLHSIAQKLSGEIVTLNATDNILAIKSDAATFELLTMKADDFPSAVTVNGDESFVLPTGDIKQLIRRTAFACSKDDTRAVFKGVQFTVGADKLTAAATNTHRIAVVRLPVQTSVNAKFIIPAGALAVLANNLRDNSGVIISTDGKHVNFDSDDTKLVSALIDGAFPDIDKVIPTTGSVQAEVDVSELRAAIERMRIIARQSEYDGLRLIFTADGLELQSQATDIGKAREHVDAYVSGGDLDITFNSGYIVDMLKATGAKVVRFTMNTPLSPALLEGIDETDFTYVVTPLRTR